MATNLVIGWPRRTEEITFAGGTWNATYPVTNLGIMPLARVARSTNTTLAATQFTGTFSTLRQCSLFALVRHNLSLSSKIRLTLYADAAMTEILLTLGWLDTWLPAYLPADLEWEDNNWWTGNLTAEDISGYFPVRPIWLGRPYNIRAFKIEIDDQSNAAGWVQLGMCDVSLGWEVGKNPDFGYQEGFRIRSEFTEALGGGKIFDRRDKPRVARAQFTYLARNEALSRGFELQRQADINIPFMWLPFPDEVQHWTRTVYMARLVDPDLMSLVEVDYNNFSIAVEEVL